MVLVIGDSKINREITIDELYNNFPKLSTDGAKFASTPIREVNGSDGVLYIRQKEDVVTFHKDRFDDGNLVTKLGTQDVLTCHVVTLRSELTGVTAFAHFDEYVRLQRLDAFLKKFVQLTMNKYYYSDYLDPLDEDEWEWYSEDEEDENSEEIDDEIFENAVTLQLVGGYKEESGKGGVLSKRILSFFAQNQLEFKLTLVCLGPVNTRSRSRPEPMVGGVLCDLAASGKLSPANFNRSFVNEMPEDTVMTLMLGPSLMRKPAKLKQMILEHEDHGYSSRKNGDGDSTQTL